MTNKNHRHVYTTVDGIEIPYSAFSWSEYKIRRGMLREKMLNEGLPLNKPTYIVKFASGKTEEFPHDEKSITEGTPDEVEKQKEAWAAYIAADKKFQQEDNALLADYLYNDALESVQLPEDNSWEIKQRRRGIPIPEDPNLKRIHYIDTVLLKSQRDSADLITTIVSMVSGIKEDDIKAVIDGFWDSLWSKSKIKRDAA